MGRLAVNLRQLYQRWSIHLFILWPLFFSVGVILRPHGEIFLFVLIFFVGNDFSELLRGWKMLPLSWMLPGLRQSHRILLLLVGIPTSLLIALLYVKQAELFGVSYFFMSISLCLCLFYLPLLSSLSIWDDNKKLSCLGLILALIMFFICFFKPSLIHQILVKYPLPITLLSVILFIQSIRTITNREFHARAVNNPSLTMFDAWNQEKQQNYIIKLQAEKLAKKDEKRDKSSDGFWDKSSDGFWFRKFVNSSYYSLSKAIIIQLPRAFSIVAIWGFCGVFLFIIIVICSYLRFPYLQAGYIFLSMAIFLIFVMLVFTMLNQKEPHIYFPVSRKRKYLVNIILQLSLTIIGSLLISLLLVFCNILSQYLPPVFFRGRLWESNPLPLGFALIPMCVFPYVNAWVTLLRKKGLPYGFMAAYFFFVVIAGVMVFTLWEFYGEDAFCIIKADGGRVFIMSIVISIIPLWFINIWLVKRKYLNKDYLL